MIKREFKTRPLSDALTIFSNKDNVITLSTNVRVKEKQYYIVLGFVFLVLYTHYPWYKFASLLAISRLNTDSLGKNNTFMK